jgi:thiol-disulfide isomerase/thioredoxin
MLIQNVLSYEDFTHYLENYKYIFINVYATWCKPCKEIKPLIEKFVSVINKSEYIYLKIDTTVLEENIDFSNYFKINKIPYFAFIQDKKTQESFESPDFMIVSKKIHEIINNKDKEEKDQLSENFKIDNDF